MKYLPHWRNLFFLIAFGLFGCTKDVGQKISLPDNSGIVVQVDELMILDSLEAFFALIPPKGNPKPLLDFLNQLEYKALLQHQCSTWLPDRNASLLIINLENQLGLREIQDKIKLTDQENLSVFNYHGNDLYKAEDSRVYFTMYKDHLLLATEAVLIENFYANSRLPDEKQITYKGQTKRIAVHVLPELLSVLYSGYLTNAGKHKFEDLASDFESISLFSDDLNQFNFVGNITSLKPEKCLPVPFNPQQLTDLLQQISPRSSYISLKKIDPELLQKDSIAGINVGVKTWLGEEVAILQSATSAGSMIDALILSFKDINTEVESFNLFVEAKAVGPPEDYHMFQIYSLVNDKLFNSVFNLDMPEGVLFMVQLENHVLLATSRPYLEMLLDDIVAGNTLINDQQFLMDLEGNIDEMNSVFKADNSFFRNCFSDESLSKSFSRLQMMGFSNPCAAGENEFSIALKTNFSREEQKFFGVKQWSTTLGVEVMGAPVLVGDKIIVQGIDNTVFCLDLEGKLLWQERLRSPLLGQVQAVNLGREKVIFFNTSSEVGGMRLDGSMLPGFPKELKAVATGQMTLVDFKHNQQYAFYIPCGNMVLGFDFNGEPIAGWNPLELNTELSFSLGHFQFQGEDYFYFLDTVPSFKMLNKFGELLFPPFEMEGVYLSPSQHQTSEHAQTPDLNRMVSCNEQGKVKVIIPDGQHFNLRLSCGDNTETRFVFADFTGDQRKDYLAVSGQYVSLSGYKALRFETIFEKKFSLPIDQVFSLGNACGQKDLIGLFSATENQVYLLSPEGVVHQYFPMAATQPCTLYWSENCEEMTVILVRGEEIYAVR